MRWTLRIIAALAVAGLLFAASPFVALYRLSRSVETHDAAALAERINFRALSASLSKQLVGAYLDARERELGPAARDLAVGAGTALVDPVVSQLVTPNMLLQLLARGWPEEVAGATALPGSEGLRLRSWGEVLHLAAASEARGFRRLLVSYPPGQPSARRFRLHLRLSGATWRLVAIDLPEELRQRLAEEVKRRAERTGALRSTLSGEP